MQKKSSQTRLTCFDLDGTLVDECGNLYAGARELVEQSRLNAWTALCSARPMFSLEQHISLLGDFDFLSSCQGAFVARRVSGSLETISYDPLSDEQVKQIYEIAVADSVETWLIGKLDWFSMNRGKKTNLEEKILGSASKEFDEFASQDILKVVMLNAAPTTVKAVAKLGLYLAISKPNFLEIARHDFAKGVPKIAANLSLNRCNISCVGDGMNDLSMFNACNTSITFEDSSEALRTAATFIVAPAARGGLLDAVGILTRDEKE